MKPTALSIAMKSRDTYSNEEYLKIISKILNGK